MNTIRILFCILLISSVVGFAHTASSKVTITEVEGIHFVNLTGKITRSLDQYRPLLHLLNRVTAKDTVILQITTQGGSGTSGQVIVDALINTKATTVASIPNYAYSMGAIIVCHTTRIAMAPTAEVMFHQGKVIFKSPVSTAERKYHMKHFMDQSSRFHDVCSKKGILTKQDRAAMGAGYDVYLQAEAINKRADLQRKKK